MAADEVAGERLRLKLQGVAHQLRATTRALARLEAAVRLADRPPGGTGPTLAEVVGPDLEALRRQLGSLEEATGQLIPGTGPVAHREGDGNPW